MFIYIWLIFMINVGKWKLETSWWLNRPSEKYAQVNLFQSSPRIGVEIPKIFELPPPRLFSGLGGPCYSTDFGGATTSVMGSIIFGLKGYTKWAPEPIDINGVVHGPPING